MAINVDIERKKNENSGALLKRFTKKVQEAGVLKRVRNRRWLEKKPSPYTKKVQKIKAINKKAVMDEMFKMGKNPVQKGRRR